MSSQGGINVCFDSEPAQASPVEFCTIDDNDDDGCMVPEYDEFDMWEQQQQSTKGGADGESKETVSAFQKLFLEELSQDSDVNSAAAKALQRFMASSPTSSSASTAPEPDSPVVEFMTMCDDDDDDEKDAEEYDLDEFDLWEHRQTATDGCRSQEQTEAISSFQRLFLDEANKGGGDINGAAAEAIRKIFAARAAASQSKPATPSVAAEQDVQDDIKKKHQERFRALYLKELEKCGDANLAAAAALRRLNCRAGRARQANADAPDARRQQALRAVRSMLTKEVGTQGVDVNEAVAAAILRIRKAQEANSKVSAVDSDGEEQRKSTHAGYGGQVAVRVGASS